MYVKHLLCVVLFLLQLTSVCLYKCTLICVKKNNAGYLCSHNKYLYIPHIFISDNYLAWLRCAIQWGRLEIYRSTQYTCDVYFINWIRFNIGFKSNNYLRSNKWTKVMNKIRIAFETKLSLALRTAASKNWERWQSNLVSNYNLQTLIFKQKQVFVQDNEHFDKKKY